jgi:hypothetical protein
MYLFWDRRLISRYRCALRAVEGEMVLAAAVLLLQLSAVSQNPAAQPWTAGLTPGPTKPVQPAAGIVSADRVESADTVESSASEDGAQPIATGDAASPASMDGPGLALLSAGADAPAFAFPLEPGRLTPTPAVTASLAPEPALAPSPAPAAFIATPVSGDRARLEEQRNKHLWMVLALTEHSAATFDAWTTRYSISNVHAQEMDPLLRPFAGNASIYVVIQAGPAVLEYVSWRMMHSHHEWEHRVWWMPQVLGAGMNFGSGLHNLTVR